MKYRCEHCEAEVRVVEEKVAGVSSWLKCRTCGNRIEDQALLQGSTSGAESSSVAFSFRAVEGSGRPLLAPVGSSISVISLIPLLLTTHDDGTLRGRALFFCSSGAVFFFLGTVLATLFQFVKIQVGADGLTLHRWVRRRFISYADVLHVTGEGKNIIVTRRKGTTMQLGVNRSVGVAPAVARRIEEVRAAFAAATNALSPTALLLPGGRAVRAWVCDMRGLGERANYRTQDVSRESLWSVLENPAAPAAARVGAAVALSTESTVEDRARVRVAALACAAPKLRVALDGIASGDEEAELESALEPVARAGA